MKLRARQPDITYFAASTLVAFVQLHYWDVLADRFGGTRAAEWQLRNLAASTLQTVTRPGWVEGPSYDHYLNLLNNTIGIAGFCLPALCLLLYGRIRSPRLTSNALRIGVALYIAWILVLSPAEYMVKVR